MFCISFILKLWRVSSAPESVRGSFHRFIANLLLIYLESKEKFLTNQCEKPDDSKASVKSKLNSWLYLKGRGQRRQDAAAGLAGTFGGRETV